jgi:hypothetical protein
MGKLTLLLVMAVAVGGTLLSMNTRGMLGDASRARAEGQADLLARQIAESAQAIALTAMIGETGFQNPGITGPRDLQGGQYEVQIDTLNPQFATFSVEGSYGGAVHTIRSTYQYDPLEYPGPIWLDVPYATASVSAGADISNNPNVQFDRRRHDQLQLEGFLPLGSMTSAVGASLATAGTALDVPSAGAWAGKAEDLNVADAEGLYMAVVSSMDAGDQTLSGAQAISGTQTWGGADQVTYVDGNLTVLAGGTLAGSGALAVHGSLAVQAGGTLNWDGIIVLKSEQDVLPVSLDGTVSIAGGLVVVHQALPPGGHLDVTVNMSHTGMTTPQGDLSGAMAPWAGLYPFHQHTHAFDLTPDTAPRGNVVYFAEGGAAGRHEAEVQFWNTIQAAGNEEIYLEIANPGEHGYSRITLNLADFSEPLRASARSGFGTFADPGSAFKTQRFPADDLRDLVLDVRSLRALKEKFDGSGGCENWPLCVAESWWREGAMSLRVVRASDNARLYDASLYWHMRLDEVAAHEAEEEAWRTAITGGSAFGTHLRMGPDVQIEQDMSPIIALSDKLGFDGVEVLLLESTSSHFSAGDARALAAASAPTTPTTPATPATPTTPATPATPATPVEATPEDPMAAGPPDNPLTAPEGEPRLVCHSGEPLTITTGLLTHLAHGDTVGGCPDTAPANVYEVIVLCHNGASVSVRPDQYQEYIALGATYGSCPANTGASPAAGIPNYPFYACLPNGQTRLVDSETRYQNFVVSQGGTIGACP